MEGEKQRRRKYDRDFILEAVKEAQNSGNVAETARNLGIHENQLYTWKRKFEADPENSFPGKGRMKPLEEELRRVKRELERTQRERDILKKAVGIFSKDPKRYSDL
jgi:transposase